MLQEKWQKMISDNTVMINLVTTDGNTTSTENHMVGGAFMGNTVETDSFGNIKVTAHQEINPNVLRSADEHTETSGKMIMHEVTETYEGARISQKTGISSPPANIAGSVFLRHIIKQILNLQYTKRCMIRRERRHRI